VEPKDVADPIEWARLVCDRTILKSKDRHKLRQALENYLTALSQRYVANPAPVFPSEQEFQKLHDLCLALASLVGKQDFKSTQYFLSAIKRIDNRFSKLGVATFFDGILGKFLKLDVPPRTIIYDAIQACGSTGADKAGVLRQIYDVLGSEEWRPSLESRPWETWLEVIQPLRLGTVAALTGPRGDVGPQKLAVEKAFRNNQRVFAYFVFMDLIRQQHLWMRRLDRATKPTVKWLFLLQRPEDIAKLQKVVHGNFWTRKQFAAEKNRQRRIRSYRKLHLLQTVQ
jgi:hypothetical protein